MMKGKLMSTRRVVGVVLAGVLLVVLASAAPAVAAAPWWYLSSNAAPSVLPLGGEGQIVVAVGDVGDAEVSGSGAPVTITDKLPAGLTATAISAEAGFDGVRGAPECSLSSLTCRFAGTLATYEQIDVKITAKVAAGASSGGENEVAVSGGGAPRASLSRPVTVGDGATPFGVESYGLRPEEEGGALDTQAGSHPFQLTGTLALNKSVEPVSFHPVAPELVKDLHFNLPRGLIGNPSPFPHCTDTQFTTVDPHDEYGTLCPADTVIGVASVTFVEPYSFSQSVAMQVPLYNLAPTPGEPARFGFTIIAFGVQEVLDTSVRTGGDYGLVASVSNVPEDAALLSSQVTFWGVPGDPRHDPSRGANCLMGGQSNHQGASCTPPGQRLLAPLMTLPTSCTGPLQSSLEVDSWTNSGSFLTVGLSEPGVSLDGCDRIGFHPSLSVAPDTTGAGSPSGLTTDLRLPQNEAPFGLAEGNLRKAVVTLPAGVVVNPSGADGLEACTQEEIGLNNASPVSCPDASKIGTVEAVSPALSAPLVGSVYVAQQGNNPFGSLLAVYVAVEGDGVLVKSAGEVHLDPVTGRLTATFDELPQQAVSDISLHFFGGARAPLATPRGCGTYTTTSKVTSYSSLTPAEPSSSFAISSGCGTDGGFAPSFSAGTVDNQAGGFSPLSVTLSRTDGDQNLGGLSVTAPPGLLGVLKSVQLCGEPQASQGTCGSGSLIGHTTVGAGAGPDPFYVQGGQVFLTGPYKGAPFGLSVVVPAVAGPFNLGNVVVRAAINVDPHTAQITVVSDPLPSILQGIPLDVRTVNVTIDRSGFTFNPTSCDPLAVTGTVTSTQGTQAAVSSRFQAANCASLGFHPSFTVSTRARTSKQGGASLDVKLGYPSGAQANIRSVAVSLPKQLPSRLTTIQQACPEATFAANPASCPAGSDVGIATATTPVLASAVTGPAYLVSHGGAAFPDLVLILQGEGVTVDLVGSIDIKKGVTSSTFASVPDVPVSAFDLSFPQGPHSALTTNLPAKAKGNLCGQSLVMPTTITGQNGAQIRQSTKVAITGCAKAKPTRRTHGKKKKAKKHKQSKRK